MVKEHMKYMSPVEKQAIRSAFLKDFGEYLNRKRLGKNISMEDLADFLDVSQSTMSRYENGNSDMSISNIPLLSLYCGFSMKNCFSSLKMLELIDSFRDIVNIKKHRYQREYGRKNTVNRQEKKLKAQIYEIDGAEVTEYISRKEKDHLSYREQLARGDIELFVKPYTDEEFEEYLKRDENEELLAMLDGACHIIKYIGDAPRKETVKSQIADFVVDNLIVERMTRAADLQAERAYMYYKRLLDLDGDEWDGPIR